MSRNYSVSPIYKLCGFMAFAAMFISGLIGVLGLADVSLPGIVAQIGNIMLIAAVAIMGFYFVMTSNLPGPNIVWRVIFIVFVILAATGTINAAF